MPRIIRNKKILTLCIIHQRIRFSPRGGGQPEVCSEGVGNRGFSKNSTHASHRDEVYGGKSGRVLLGMKKKGFGAGRWNGFGGKVEKWETIEEAAKREVREEAGVEVSELEKVGVIEFEFQGNPELLEVHIFKATNFTGTPSESDEMRPQWFPTDQIPFDEMWSDDPYWVPLFLDGKKFRAKFLFGPGDKVLKHQIIKVKKL